MFVACSPAVPTTTPAVAPPPAPVGPAPRAIGAPGTFAPIEPPPAALVTALALSPSYTKHLDVDGLPVLASARVSDAAVREAAFLVRKMIGHRPDVIRAIAAARVRIVVMATTEMTTDVPEHTDLVPRQYWDRRARGVGATAARPATSCAEENLLGLEGDPYAAESICIHELSHTIMEIGMAGVDATFRQRLEAAYQNARQAGLWRGTYAMTDVTEYWAEAAQSWFDTNRVNDSEHGAVATREQVIAHDPGVAALLTEVYGANGWRYRRPAQRAPADAAHLAGFDRTRAPRFAWPDERPADAVARLPLLAADPGRSPSSSAATTILFVNRRATDVAVLWNGFDGHLTPYATVRPGTTHAQQTYAGHAWLIRDAAGATLGWVVAAPTPGQIEIP